MPDIDDSLGAAGSFVPLERLRRNRPEPNGALIASVKDHLRDLAGQLSPAEQEALSRLLFKTLDSRDSVFAELAALPPEAVMKPQEVETYNRLLARPSPTATGLPSSLALIVKGTRLCNLRCTYCRSWAEGPDEVMPFEVMARTIQSACAAPGVDAVEFIWHGGETTMRPIAFYRKALWLQERFRRPGQRINNHLQTNATHLSPEWLDFLKRYRILVGVSLDGPPEVHDLRRLDIKGQPTSERVRAGIEKLQSHGIPFEIKMVVDDEVIALGARRILDYLLEIGVQKVALLNVVPEGEPDRKLPGDYLEFPRFVTFLRELFQLWWPTHAERISFREISDLMGRLRDGSGHFCVFDENCMGGIYTIEPMGDIAACDRYQGDPDFKFGNILGTEFSDLPSSPNLARAHTETDAEMDLTSHCRWFDVCHGGCPHDRYVRVHRGVSRSEKCCGWSPLLTDIAAALQVSSVSTSPK